MAGRAAFFAIALFLWLIPSIGLIHKYTGNFGLVASIPITLLLIWVIAAFDSRSLPRHWVWMLVAIAVGLFSILYPIAKSGWLGGGSDRDDALNVALGALLSGDYPYSVKTYLNQPVTPMPGALLIGLPFYLLGNSALQNLLWIPLLILWCVRSIETDSRQFGYLVLFLFAAPAAMQDFVTGGDYLTNAIYVALAMYLVVRSQSSAVKWHRYAAAAVLAVALSSRPIYAVAGPLLTGMIYRDFGLARSLRFVAIVLAVGLILNLPFFIYNPQQFPTHHLLQKASPLPRWMHAGIVLPAAAMLIGCLSFFRRIDLWQAFGIMGLAIALMIYPALVAGLFVWSFNNYSLSVFGWALPVSIFAGLWLVSRRTWLRAAR